MESIQEFEWEFSQLDTLQVFHILSQKISKVMCRFRSNMNVLCHFHLGCFHFAYHKGIGDERGSGEGSGERRMCWNGDLEHLSCHCGTSTFGPGKSCYFLWAYSAIQRISWQDLCKWLEGESVPIGEYGILIWLMRSFDPEMICFQLTPESSLLTKMYWIFRITLWTTTSGVCPCVAGPIFFCVFLNLGFLPVQVHFDTWGAEHDEWIAKDSQAGPGKAREFHRLMVDTRI